jgi:transposase
VIQAKLLPRLIESGMASTALVTHVVVLKFAWYLPLYRQVRILAGQGIHLDRATLSGWVKRAAWWLKSRGVSTKHAIRSSQRKPDNCGPRCGEVNQGHRARRQVGANML